ncbi:ATP-dependent DNA/RNA helicase DHX36 [Condylostylus longicornis]|uniref:ATP-dependent DNA/RNA helicase DHX36 n=1 Tax=Condylostylus longicornis TaxID=2530218 RepID=UPI00244E0014|nr:ATP-dependent DNA/RNA helicase DHX36 [Condylostylus longicornis]
MKSATKRNCDDSRSPPSHLRGRELGLYYKQLSKEKRADETSKKVVGGRIILPDEFIQQIEDQLNAIEQENLCKKINLNFETYFNEIINSSFQECLKEKSQELKELVPFGTFSPQDHVDRTLTEMHLKLPVFNYSEQILKSLSENTFVLISGDTGCGKTTQIPQIILDDYIKRGYGSYCNIICTQPRRISAISVAERVAFERSEKLGKSVGYQIRLENRFPRSCASILYCTTGVLLRRLETDPLLSNVSHVILDEIHERNIESDILIGLLKQITKYNKKLKVVLMSATFGIEDFAKHFNDSNIIQIEGTLFPVKVNYLEDVLEEIKFFKFPNPKSFLKDKPKYVKHLKSTKNQLKKQSDFEDFINPYARNLRGEYSPEVIKAIQNPTSEEINLDMLKALVFYIDSKKDPGAILIFFPGYEKISKFHEILRTSQRRSHMLIYPLHSMMPTLEQKGVFEKPPDGMRKIILATNIAETSITIDDIVYVINTGKVKYKDYNISRNYSTLQEHWVTIAHSKQRQGRAGRCQPGICYNLYTKAREYTLEEYPLPEILRSRLEPVILNLKMLRIHDVKEFMSTLISCPQEASIDNGIKLLKRLNALDENENITPLGLHLAKLPLDPQIGKMILMAAIFQCIDPITSAAATLSFKDPFYRPIGKESEVDRAKNKFSESSQSDHLTYGNVISEFRKHRNNSTFLYDNFLAFSTLNQLEHMKTQLCELLHSAGFINHSDPRNEISNANSSRDHLLRAIIAGGLYPNVAVIRKVKQLKNRVTPVMHIETPEDGVKVKIHPSSVNSKERSFDSKFLVFFNIQKSTDVFLHDTTMVYPISLLIFGDQVAIKRDGVDDKKWYINMANNSYQFESNEKTAKIILKLRNRFDVLLRDLALNPTVISDDKGRDRNLIDAMVMILAYESGSEDNYEYR